jgi:hypothetical protein
MFVLVSLYLTDVYLPYLPNNIFCQKVEKAPSKNNVWYQTLICMIYFLVPSKRVISSPFCTFQFFSQKYLKVTPNFFPVENYIK